MIFRCPKCGKGYTLPITDIMTDKQISCDCGVKTKHFKLVGRDFILPPSLDIQEKVVV